MCQLTEQQIAIVTSDVENEGINFSHLKFDLIDHVCCDIESNLARGISFNQAYDLVKKEFGIKGLRQIQQDTLMLIDKNYRIMKKSMKMIGVLAMALMAFGALFKIGHWPGASIMLLVGFFFTALVFFPTLLYIVHREVNRKNQAALYVTAFLSGLFFMAGVLFKIQHWPGAQLLLFSGLGLITFVLLPLIIIFGSKTSSINKTVFVLGLISLIVFLTGLILKIQHWPGASIMLTAGSLALVLAFAPMFYVREVAKTEKPRIDFIFGIIALTYFIVFGFLLALNTSQSALIDFNYQDKSFRATANYFSNRNTFLLKDIKSEKALQLANQADIVVDYIDTIKIMIVQNNGGVSKAEAIQLNESNHLIIGNETTYLISANNPNSPLPRLKAELDSFKRLYDELFTDSLNQISNTNNLLNTNNIMIGNNDCLISWEEYHFSGCESAAALSTLSLWQYNIRLAENRALSVLVNNPNNN